MKHPITHGGDSTGLRRRLGLGDGPILDFSTTSNPLGPPPKAIEAARHALGEVDRLPEPGSPRLTERIADLHGISPGRVIVGAGTTELIGLAGQSLRDVLAFHAQALGDPTRPLAHLVDPGYGEFRRVSAQNELRAKVWGEHVLGWAQDVRPEGAAGVFWAGHPSNPTGRAWDRDTLVEFVDSALGLLTIVDEGSLPFLPDEAGRSLVNPAATRDNLLVLRSLTKFFGMPGLRVGYAVAPPDMVTRLRQYQDPWTLAAPAEAAALAALDDAEYRERTLDLVPREAARMLDRLWEIPGLRPAWPDRVRPEGAPPPPNFLLVGLTQTDWDSIGLRDALARRGSLVRECSDFPGLEVGALVTGPDRLVATRGHLRIGVRTPAEDDRLLASLSDLLASDPSS